MADSMILEPVLPASPVKPPAYRKLLRNPGVVFGATIIAIVLLMGLLAPWLGTIDPTAINPIARNKVPGAEFSMRTDTGERIKMIAAFGTDGLGRDVYSRVIYGARVSLCRSSVWTVIIAITVPQIPGVVRLVRSIVLSVREEPYVEAAVTLGTSTPKLLWRHVLPNTVAPMIVQGTFICASAILIEATR